MPDQRNVEGAGVGVISANVGNAIIGTKKIIQMRKLKVDAVLEDRFCASATRCESQRNWWMQDGPKRVGKPL